MKHQAELICLWGIMNVEVDGEQSIWYAATISLLWPHFNLSTMGSVFEEYL